MKVSKLSKLSIAIASLMMTSSAAYAAMDMDSRVSQLEKQMSQVRTENPMGTYGANTASARPDLVDGNGWFFTADVLYWHGKVGGTDYAYSDQDPTAQLPIKGRNKDISFDWDWGLRAGVGYRFEHDGWDLSAQYTLFDSNGAPMRAEVSMTLRGRYLPKGQLSGNYINALLQPKKETSTATSVKSF